MFRKVISSFTRLLANSVTAATKINPKPLSDQDKYTLDLYNKLQGNGSNEKVQAYISYREALNELNTEKINDHDMAVTSAFLKSKELDPKTLSMSDLLNLATTNFTGLKAANEEYSIKKDVNNAIKLWTIAEEKGSLEGSYRIASCHRTGEGVPKDVEKAFSMYQALVAKDYPEAHVSIIAF